MDTHHHKGDVTARTISPERAFLFARLRIGEGLVVGGRASSRALILTPLRRCLGPRGPSPSHTGSSQTSSEALARRVPGSGFLPFAIFLRHSRSNRIAFGDAMIYHAGTHTHYGLESKTSGQIGRASC